MWKRRTHCNTLAPQLIAHPTDIPDPLLVPHHITVPITFIYYIVVTPHCSLQLLPDAVTHTLHIHLAFCSTFPYRLPVGGLPTHGSDSCYHHTVVTHTVEHHTAPHTHIYIQVTHTVIPYHTHLPRTHLLHTTTQLPHILPHHLVPHTHIVIPTFGTTQLLVPLHWCCCCYTLPTQPHQERKD